MTRQEEVMKRVCDNSTYGLDIGDGIKMRPPTKHYNKLGNGLIDLPDCNYVIETYANKEKRAYQTIMFNYDDDNERNHYRSIVHEGLRMLRREYFDRKGKLIFLEDFRHAGNS